MIDTVKLESPYLSESVASDIEKKLVWRGGVDLSSGELLYELTSGSLEGSWDSRVSLRVLRERVVTQAGTGKNVMSSCPPYLWLEGSVHKALLGHNIFGGPEDLRASCRWFVSDVASRLSVSLPDGLGWRIRRVDWAETFRLPYEGCEAFVWAMNQARYVRRKPARYGQESVMFPGTTTAAKIYHKGPEFSKHDYPRLRRLLPFDEVAALQQTANETLRVEVQIKPKKLRYELGELPPVGEIGENWIRRHHDRDIRRILREGREEMRTVRKQRDVRDRLHQIHEPRLAGVLFGTWMQLVTLGEHETRKLMTKPTFYRQKKQLREASVSWLGSDVVVMPDSSLPSDFRPLRTDPRHQRGEDPAVTAKLRPFRAA